jgi:hypothetical protein
MSFAKHLMAPASLHVLRIAFTFILNLKVLFVRAHVTIVDAALVRMAEETQQISRYYPICMQKERIRLIIIWGQASVDYL